MPYLSASATVTHYEEALYQVYAPLYLYLYPVSRGLTRPALTYKPSVAEYCASCGLHLTEMITLP